MKIIYVNTPMQDENTKNPQVIDGEIPKWCVITEWVEKGLTLRQHLEKKWNFVKNHPNGDDVIGFYLYDVEPVHKIIDGYGNYTGESAMFVRLDYIKKSKIEKKSILDSLKDPEFGNYKNKVNHATLLDSPNSFKLNEVDIKEMDANMDRRILDVYMVGFNEELDGCKKRIYEEEIFQIAYNCGRDAAIIGDDIPSYDYRSNEEILNQIKNQKNE